MHLKIRVNSEMKCRWDIGKTDEVCDYWRRSKPGNMAKSDWEPVNRCNTGKKKNCHGKVDRTNVQYKYLMIPVKVYYFCFSRAVDDTNAGRRTGNHCWSFYITGFKNTSFNSQAVHKTQTHTHTHIRTFTYTETQMLCHLDLYSHVTECSSSKEEVNWLHYCSSLVHVT